MAVSKPARRPLHRLSSKSAKHAVTSCGSEQPDERHLRGSSMPEIHSTGANAPPTINAEDPAHRSSDLAVSSGPEPVTQQAAQSEMNGHSQSNVRQMKAAEPVDPPRQPGNTATEEPRPAQSAGPAATGPALTDVAKQAVVGTMGASPLSLDAATERIEGLLRRLALEHDPERFFQEKVLTTIPGCEKYYERIKQPMWLSRIIEKLKNREYRTLHQIQSDVELICHNAMFFNQKTSKVHKNAQALLKAAKRQFQVEKELLREAIFVLHPEGQEKARKDEIEQIKTLKMAPPPKKPPMKPHKPSRADKKLVTKPSSGGIHSEMPIALSFIAPNDLQMDYRCDSDPGYSSFSDSELDKGELPPQELPWRGRLPESRPQGFSEATTISQSRPGEWKLQRQNIEWRIRWLDLRLKELSHQHKRYSDKLELLEGVEASAMQMPQNVKEIEAQATTANVVGSELNAKESTVENQAGVAKRQPAETPQGGLGNQVSARQNEAEPPQAGRKQRKRRRIAAGMAGQSLLANNSFMAAHAGLKFTDKREKDSFAEDWSTFPARIYAGAEILEQQMWGLRQQLCQPGSAAPWNRHPASLQVGSKSKVKSGRQLSKSLRPAKRSRHSDPIGGYVMGPTGSVPLPEKVFKPIATPQFHQFTADDRAEQLALFETLQKRDLLKKERRNGVKIGAESSDRGDASTSAKENKDEGAPPPEGVSKVEDQENWESSSSEDTSDEKYTHMHIQPLIDERIRHGTAEKADKKKKKLKASKPSDGDAQNDADTPSLVVKTGLPKRAHLQNQNVTVTVNVKDTPEPSLPAVHTPRSLQITTTMPPPPNRKTDDQQICSGSPRGRGSRGRGRGRPPGSVKVTSTAANSRRIAGPGRGHRGRGQKSLLGQPSSTANSETLQNITPVQPAPAEIVAPAPKSAEEYSAAKPEVTT